LQDPFELLLVGDGPEIEQTRMKIEQLGLSGKVKVLGARKDVGAILSKAGLMVLATNWEGLPRSILEGMRAGLPIVATDVGGNSELVKDGINGCLVPRGDEQALRLAISRLLGSPALRSKMGI
jgi:glycosyltransferase involved in cell wall biosynthesis